MYLGDITVHSVHSMHGRSMQMTTKYPPAVKVVEKSCYMDDLMPSLKWVEMVNECILMIFDSRFGLTISFPRTNTQVFNNDELANLPSLFSIGENINVVENVSEFTYLGQTSAIKIKAVLQTEMRQVITDQKVNMTTGTKLMGACMRCRLLYGTQAWYK